jgi:hypothetical protein
MLYIIIIRIGEWYLLGCYAVWLFLVRTGGSEELSASFIRVTRIDELGTKMSVFTRATWHNIPGDAILHIKFQVQFHTYFI